MNPKVLIFDNIDLFERGYVKNLFDVNEKKTFKKAKLITNTYNLEVDNVDDFFSANNPASLFSGSDWRYSGILIYNEDDNLIWEGIIVDIIRNHETKKATLVCKNTFFKYRRDLVIYQSSNWETGAAAFKNICDYVGFTKYNIKAYTDSNSKLDAEGCKLKCDFTQKDGVTFLEAIGKLADYNNADLYVHNDELYFVHWQPFVGGIKIHLEGDKKGVLKQAPIVSSPENNILNDYSIDYYESGDKPATDSNSDKLGVVSRNRYGIHKLEEMKTGSSQQIVFMDKASAVYIGNSYMYKTNKNLVTDPEPPQRNEFHLFSDHKDLIDLRTYFQLSFSEEGWDRKKFEVFEFTVNKEEDDIPIISYEVW